MTVQAFKRTGPWVVLGDRKRAEKRFAAILAQPDGLRRLMVAREEYSIQVSAMMRLKRSQGLSAREAQHFILHLCTWLDRWEDYFVDDERTECLVPTDEQQQRGYAEFLRELAATKAAI